MPKVSVIMPVYNGEQYLREAIDSILAQTFTDFEFLIINDCSCDSTKEIIQSYPDSRIVYLENESNLGVAKSLNRGLALAKGDYIARMDADDISLPKRLEKQVAYMEKHPEIDVLATQVQNFGEKNSHVPTGLSHHTLKVTLLFNTCLCHPTVMFRNSAFTEGELYYNEQFSKLEDYALWAKLCQSHQFGCCNEILFQYRIHKNQVTQNYDDAFMSQFSELKKELLKPLHITDDNPGFQAFVKMCIGQKTAPDQSEQLRSFCLLIHRQNKLYHVYHQKTLDQSLRGVIASTFADNKAKRAFFRSHKDLFSKSILDFCKYIRMVYFIKP